MATIPTTIGPVGARQINRNLYVGQSDLTTIQKAVTVAATIGGLFVVVVPFDYAGSDTIAAVTGGSASIEIFDRRGAQAQSYIWSGAQYVPGTFQQAAGFAAMGLPSAIPAGSASFYFDPTGTFGAGTAHLNFTANAGESQPGFLLNGIASDGSGLYTYYRLAFTLPGAIPGGVTPITTIAQMEAPLQLNLFNGGFENYNLFLGGFTQPGGKGMTVWAKDAEDAIDLQGLTIGGVYDQTIRLNYLGGNVQIGPLTFDAAGNIIGIADITADSITAGDADFDTCEVNSSPVRTFANTPDGPGQGMVWPTDGIPVSMGDHWQSPSISPASIATWPAAGIPVSTGTAWGTSINPATMTTPLSSITAATANATLEASGYTLNIQSNGTAGAHGNVSIQAGGGSTLIGTAVSGLNVTPVATQIIGSNATSGIPTQMQGLALGWNAYQGGGRGEVDFVCARGGGGGGFGWFNVPGNSSLTSATTYAMFLDNGNLLSVTGGIFTPGTVSAGVFTSTGASTLTTLSINGAASSNIANSTRISVTGGICYYDMLGANAATHGQAFFRSLAGDGTASINTLNVSSAGIAITGTMSASGAKTFVIIHPLDDTKNLVHACLEGPEVGLYYRGEGVTDGGWAEITLPDYFEVLTMPTDRSVLLTALFEEDADLIGQLAASRVKDGKFKVWSALPAQKFYWEVKAVRADIQSLEVEPWRKANDEA